MQDFVIIKLEEDKACNAINSMHVNARIAPVNARNAPVNACNASQ